MIDERFGELAWDDVDDVWTASVPLAYFQEFGTNLASVPEEDPGPAAAMVSESEPTLGQIRAHQALEAEMEHFPPDQRAMFATMLAAVQGGISRGDSPEVPAAGEEDEDPLDPRRLFREGRFLLAIDPGGRRKPPSAAQGRAWDRVRERGDALWDELMARLLAEYRLQRPVRVRWWKAVYGDYHLERALPEVADAGALKALLRPSHIRILPAPKRAETAEIEFNLECTWNSGELEVRIRDGEVAAISSGITLSLADRPTRARLEHPVFGSLARHQEEGPWTGGLVCASFRDYLAMIANQRAEFRNDPAARRNPQSVMPWDFVHGRFELRVHAPPGEMPGESQAKALSRFLEDESRNAAVMVQAIFDYYRSVYEVARSEFMDRYPDENVPPPTGPEILHDRLQLETVHIFPEDAEGRVKLGFVFLCLWNPGPAPDLGVRWCDGAVEAVGRASTARPQSPPA